MVALIISPAYSAVPQYHGIGIFDDDDGLQETTKLWIHIELTIEEIDSYLTM